MASPKKHEAKKSANQAKKGITKASKQEKQKKSTTKARTLDLKKCEHHGCTCPKYLGNDIPGFCHRESCRHRDHDHKLAASARRPHVFANENAITMSSVQYQRPDPSFVSECRPGVCCDVKPISRKTPRFENDPRDAHTMLAVGYGHWVVRGLSNYVVATVNYGSLKAQQDKGVACFGGDLLETYWAQGQAVYYDDHALFCMNRQGQIVC
jgi:hypothetical protein